MAATNSQISSDGKTPIQEQLIAAYFYNLFQTVYFLSDKKGSAAES